MGAFLAILTTAIWGVGFVATRFTLEQLPPLWSNGVRFLCAVLLLAPLALPRVRRMSRAQIEGGLLLGAALYACFALQTSGLARTSVAHSSFITGTYVVLVPLLAAALKRDRLRARHLVAAATALVGLALLAGVRRGGFRSGDLLTLGCALACAAHIVIADGLAQGTDPWALNLVQMTVVVVLSALSAPLIEGIPRHVTLSPHLALGLVYLAVLSSCVAFTLQFAAQRRLRPAPAAMLFLLESPFGALAGLLLLGEKMDAPQWLGAGIVLAASVIAALPERSARPEGFHPAEPDRGILESSLGSR